jgi:BlaI family penicillinase repressor
VWLYLAGVIPEERLMTDRPALSRAEMEVARIVWTLREASVRQVLDNLPETRDINYKTVQTFLRRLEAKGYLVSRREGRSLIYTADARPKQVIRDTVKNFINNLFNGQPLPLVEHLIREYGMSQEEMDQLKGMLNEPDANLLVKRSVEAEA